MLDNLFGSLDQSFRHSSPQPMMNPYDMHAMSDEQFQSMRYASEDALMNAGDRQHYQQMIDAEKQWTGRMNMLDALQGMTFRSESMDELDRAILQAEQDGWNQAMY